MTKVGRPLFFPVAALPLIRSLSWRKQRDTQRED
jgi:hypothetical protein